MIRWIKEAAHAEARSRGVPEHALSRPHPGQPQFPWEAPRLAQFPVGGTTDGLPVRLARLANRNGLKACGNSIVPQVAAAVIWAMVAHDLST